MRYFILAIGSMFNKVINFLFGKMQIFTVILGWILIISGIIFFFKPERARKKMLGQGFGVIKGVLALMALYFIFSLVLLAGKAHGILSSIILLVLLAVIVLFFKLKKSTFIRLQEQFKKIPTNILRIYAVIQIIIGIVMVLLKHRVV